MPEKSIFIAEDEGIIADELRVRLRNLGYDVVGVASRGQESIDIVGDTLPDIVLMDINLQGDMDGIQAGNEIRTRFNIPVVYLTAYGDDETLQRAKMTMPHGYIIKPFEERELRAIIEISLHNHEMERKLRESGEKYRSVVENANEAIFIAQDGVLKYFNPKTLQITGYKEDELSDKPFIEVVHPADRELIVDRHTRRLAGEDIPNIYSFRIIDASGGTRWVEINSVQVSWEGHPATLSFVTDVTDRRIMEVERERLISTLEGKRKDMQQILYIASHDLRSPMVNIQGYTSELESMIDQMTAMLKDSSLPSVARDKISSLEPEEMKISTQYIFASVEKINQLINGMLKISRLYSSQLDKESLDMNNLLSDIIKVFEFRLHDCNSRITLSDLPPCVGDRDQLDQVFSNLIDNALKYRDPQRELHITITGDRAQDSVFYRVEDTGIGIPEEQLEKIFDIFHRVNKNNTKIQGEGLGLTSVRSILDRHDGHIAVESQSGHGSVFTVSLPDSM